MVCRWCRISCIHSRNQPFPRSLLLTLCPPKQIQPGTSHLSQRPQGKTAQPSDGLLCLKANNRHLKPPANFAIEPTPSIRSRGTFERRELAKTLGPLGKFQGPYIPAATPKKPKCGLKRLTNPLTLGGLWGGGLYSDNRPRLGETKR